MFLLPLILVAENKEAIKSGCIREKRKNVCMYNLIFCTLASYSKNQKYHSIKKIHSFLIIGFCLTIVFQSCQDEQLPELTVTARCHKCNNLCNRCRQHVIGPSTLFTFTSTVAGGATTVKGVLIVAVAKGVVPSGSYPIAYFWPLIEFLKYP